MLNVIQEVVAKEKAKWSFRVSQKRQNLIEPFSLKEAEERKGHYKQRAQ
jgi:hypothetical protein